MTKSLILFGQHAPFRTNIVFKNIFRFSKLAKKGLVIYPVRTQKTSRYHRPLFGPPV
jgi:hypothetical protein